MVSAAYNTLIIFCAELYEVKMRTTILMILASVGCIGSFIAPTVKYFLLLFFKVNFLT